MARHVPVRTCLGCGQKKERRALTRLVAVGDGGVEVDRAARRPGRGAWLCGPGCLTAALKRKAFGKAFRGKVTKVDAERLSEALVKVAGLQG